MGATAVSASSYLHSPSWHDHAWRGRQSIGIRSVAQLRMGATAPATAETSGVAPSGWDFHRRVRKRSAVHSGIYLPVGAAGNPDAASGQYKTGCDLPWRGRYLRDVLAMAQHGLGNSTTATAASSLTSRRRDYAR